MPVSTRDDRPNAHAHIERLSYMLAGAALANDEIKTRLRTFFTDAACKSVPAVPMQLLEAMFEGNGADVWKALKRLGAYRATEGERAVEALEREFYRAVSAESILKIQKSLSTKLFDKPSDFTEAIESMLREVPTYDEADPLEKPVTKKADS